MLVRGSGQIGGDRQKISLNINRNTAGSAIWNIM
jgi:hypothetical protein